MDAIRGYRSGAAFFGLTLAVGLAALPFGISCCSRFSTEDQAWRATHADVAWADGITPLALALLDWPLGFRLLLMAIAASAIGLALMLLLRSIAERMNAGSEWALTLPEFVLSSILVGVLYILALYLQGYFGYWGQTATLWMLGIPMVIAWVGRPQLAGFAWGIPLAIGGWVGSGIPSMTVGIPLD